MSNIVIINGPNLNLLGKRDPAVYGTTSFEEYLAILKVKFPSAQIQYFQSNIEGEIVDKLHEVGFNSMGIVLNAGGYTHTSVAIADAVAAVTSAVVEVHISNVYSREEFRHHSLMAASCRGVIAGFGLNSYFLAIRSLIDSA